MRLGFDIDDTLIDLRRHAFHLYQEKLGVQVEEAAFDALEVLEIHRLFGLTKEQGSEMWFSTMEDIYFTDCPSFPYAVELLNELASEGHEIYYVTSRPKHVCGRTREWVKAAGFPVVDERFFCGMEDHEKVDTIARLGLDVYIDDKLPVLNTLTGLQTKLVVRDQPYNRDSEFARLRDWTEFRALLNT